MFMKRKRNFYILSIIVLSAFLSLACNGNKATNAVVEPEPAIVKAEDSTPVAAADCETEWPYREQVPAAESGEREVADEATVPTESVNRKSEKTQAVSYGKKETLYISTYGANGKVWGHVTMNGKTGRGTIHDDDENSYSITVTRHGGELYGTDQNGRQYVFRL